MMKALGKAYFEGILVMGLAEMFPTDKAARKWFEAKIRPNGCRCPRCSCMETVVERTGQPLMPFWCRTCKRYFYVRIGTIEDSPLSLRNRVWALYLHLTSLKSVFSMKLRRDLKVMRKIARFMLRRIRETFKRDDDEPSLESLIDVDEAYFGILHKNVHKA